MFKINVILNNIKWKYYLKRPNYYIENKIKNINKKKKLHKNKTIFFTLLLSGNNEIKRLNKKFRNKDKSTDVLSFPFYGKNEFKNKINKEKEIYIGDIIVNINKINEKNNIKNFRKKFDKLWIHGLVHLLGYDHKKNKDFSNMLKVEKKFLSFLN